jgi:hypothetical protein
MEIVTTAVPSGFWENSEGPNLRLAIVFSMRPPQGRKFDSLNDSEKQVINNWPATLEEVSKSNFKVTFQPADAALPAQSWDAKAMMDSLKKAAWGDLFQTQDSFHDHPATGGGPSATSPITSYPAWSARQTLRHFYRHSMEGSLRPIVPKSKVGVIGGDPPTAVADLKSLNLFATDVGNNRIPAATMAPLGGARPRAVLPSDVPADVAKFRADRNLRRLTSRPEDLQEWVSRFAAGEMADRTIVPNVSGGGSVEPDPHSLVQLAVFHRRVPGTSSSKKVVIAEVSAAGGTSPSILEGDLDIFQRISLVWNFPALLQPLGLVVLLNVPLRDNRVLSAGGRLSVKPNNELGQNFVPVWTRYEIQPATSSNAGFFRAADRPGTVYRHGYLDLSHGTPNTTFRLDNLDIDGTSLKVLNAAEVVAKHEGAIVYTSSEDPYGPIIESNEAARQLFKPTVTTFAGVRLSDFICNPDCLAQYTPETLRSTVWKTLSFGTALGVPKQRVGGQKLDPPDPIEGTALAATAVRYEGQLYKVQWQLYNGGAYVKGEKDQQLPAPRTTGIGLIWNGRSAHLSEKLKSADKLRNAMANGGASADTNLDLFSNDLVLGYVPEVCVCDGSSGIKRSWLSLTKREELFGISSLSGSNGIRDGVLRLPVTQSLDAPENYASKPSPDLHAAETVFNWTGWPIGVQRPGGSDLHDEQNSSIAEKQELLKKLNRWHLPVEVKAVKGSVVPLCFGHSGNQQYLFRVKTVDVAGLKPSDFDSNEGIHLPFTYLRHEPVSPPEVLLDRVFSSDMPGKGLNRMVVDSAKSSDIRWCVPPRTSFELAERHCLMNVRSLKRLGGFDEIELRRDGSFPMASSVKNQNAAAQPVGLLPIRRARPHNVSVAVPYYPDPLARVLVARLVYWVSADKGMPIMRRTETTLPFYTGREWPKANGIKITLSATNLNNPSLKRSGCGTCLEVLLPRGMTAQLNLCCGLGQDRSSDKHLNTLALIDDFCTYEVNARVGLLGLRNVRTAIPHSARNGFVELLRPLHTIECVHTVERPLRAPAIGRVREAAILAADNVAAISREQGKPDAELTVDFFGEPQSTGILRLRASWSYIVDTDPTRAPFIQSQTADLGQLQIEPNLGRGNVPLLPLRTRHVMPDTAYRKVSYIAVGETRYREEFVNLAPNQSRLEGQAFEVEMLNCAKPPPPLVSYIVPTFGWKHHHERSFGQPRYHSIRKGGGLRVWLERPWFKSGDGELLGVVLLAPSRSDTTPADEAEIARRRHFTTQWGLDPLRNFQRIKTAPSLEDFLETESVRRGVFSDQFGGSVDIAGYKPVYCEERKGWYCDVVIDPVPADYCFIRIALVRYQPKSIASSPPVEISSIVLADFAQLVPGRSVTVYRDPSDNEKLSLKVQVMGNPTPMTKPQGDAGDPDFLQRDIKVNVFRQRDDGSWTIDLEIQVSADTVEDRPSSWLWSGSLRWKKRVGPRRLVVTEREIVSSSHPIAPGEVPSGGRVVYMDVLDL